VEDLSFSTEEMYGVTGLEVSVPFHDQHGTTYKSEAEAASILGLRKRDVVRCLRGEVQSVKGYEFRF
jgi:hypothetical protein